MKAHYSAAGRFALGTMIWASLTAPASLVTTAQDATPMATPGVAHDVPLADATGSAVGLATFSGSGDGVTLVLLIEGLTLTEAVVGREAAAIPRGGEKTLAIQSRFSYDDFRRN